MDLKIISKKKNELLKRTELTAEMQEKTIPSKQMVRDKLSALLNVPAETIAIQKIKTNFGSSFAKVYARTYVDAQALKDTEVDYIKVRNFGKEKKEGEEAQADAPASFKK